MGHLAQVVFRRPKKQRSNLWWAYISKWLQSGQSSCGAPWVRPQYSLTMAPTVFLSIRMLNGVGPTSPTDPYFFPMDAPHLGHVKDENRNPGLADTGAPQAGQCPFPAPPFFGPFVPVSG